MSTDASRTKAEVVVRKPEPKTPVHVAPVIDLRTILVTPDMASQWLGSNSEANRNLRPDRVLAYARDMRAGTWQLTSETIKIDVNGTLIDGQHRLHAVVEANTAVYMAVAFNVPSSAFKVVDSGIGRTMGDRLKGISERNRNQIAAVLRRIVAWNRKDYVGRNPITPTEQMEEFDRDPTGFTAAAAHGVDVNKQKICSPAVGGVAFYLFHRIDPEQALTFFDQLKSGANLPDGHPVLTIRNRMTRAYASPSSKLDPNNQLALLIRAWNAVRGNRTLDKAVIGKEGRVNNQNFPQPL